MYKNIYYIQDLSFVLLCNFISNILIYILYLYNLKILNIHQSTTEVEYGLNY